MLGLFWALLYWGSVVASHRWVATNRPADPLPRGKGQDWRSLTSNVTPTPFLIPPPPPLRQYYPYPARYYLYIYISSRPSVSVCIVIYLPVSFLSLLLFLYFLIYMLSFLSFYVQFFYSSLFYTFSIFPYISLFSLHLRFLPSIQFPITLPSNLCPKPLIMFTTTAHYSKHNVFCTFLINFQ